MGSTTHRLQAVQAPLPWGPAPELKMRKALNMSSLMLTHMYIHVHTHTCIRVHTHTQARLCTRPVGSWRVGCWQPWQQRLEFIRAQACFLECAVTPGPCTPGHPNPIADLRTVLCLPHRLSMTPEEHRAFWRNVQFTVDKDVVRTDRNNQFFRGEGNPNVESMRYLLTLSGLRV